MTFSEYPFLSQLGLEEVNQGSYAAGQWMGGDAEAVSVSPHNNKPIARVKLSTRDQYEEIIRAMESEKEEWMNLPAPKRGEIVRQIGEEFRKYKDALGSLISLETGKIKAEGDGEV